MRLFPFVKKPSIFTTEQQEKIVEAIQQAEKRTSGEIRIFIENRCKYIDPLDRAVELFHTLKMDATAERNAVLVYMAVKDHQLAIFADQGIHTKTGSDFWKKEVQLMITHFHREDYAAGIVKVVNEIGQALFEHFPYEEDVDKNELPDNIVFGN